MNGAANSRCFLPARGGTWAARMLLTLIFCGLAVVRPTPALSGVGFIDKRDGACLNPDRACMSVFGYISMSDVEAVRRFLEHGGKDISPVEVYLNSPGGDVEAAIQIGRQLRAAGAAAYVFSEAQCASSCVFLLAGATQRVIDGAVAIHRPTASDVTRRTPAQAQVEYQLLLREIEAFFRAMNVSEQLLDAMIAIPPEDAKYLTARELTEFGLADSDAAAQDAADSPR